jgi:predicted MPP superfamily phosphohydrolase
MARTLTWLHLSDLHACRPRTGWDARRVLETLQKDLRLKQSKHGLRPDLVFFTGDAAFGQIGDGPGERIDQQFREAHDFLTGVRQCFEPEVPQRDLYIVPGNHDVNITRISAFESAWLSNLDSVEELEAIIQDGGNEWKLLINRLRDYTHFLDTYGYFHLLTGREKLIYADVREVSGVRVGIAGFNSAWSSRGVGREEMGRLWLGGRFQLETLLGELAPHDLRIALTHHPGNWLVPEENPGFFRELRRDFQFVLHGHEHEKFVDSDADNGHTVLSAGACHEWSQGKSNGYNFVRIDLDTRHGDVWLREYDSTGGAWGPCFVAGRTDESGRWPLDHLGKWIDRIEGVHEPADQRDEPDEAEYEPKREQTPEADYEARYRKTVADRLDYVQLFGIDVPSEAKNYSLCVADELSDDEGERQDGAADEEENLTLSAEKLFDKIGVDTKRLLIRGVAGCGKTTLLRWAAVQAAEMPQQREDDWRARIPFVLRLRDYPDGELPRPKDYPLVLAKVLPERCHPWQCGN